MGKVNNLKHYDLHEYYTSYTGVKAKYNIFIARVLRYGKDKEIAIQKYIKLNGKHMIKGIVDDNGRECTKCQIYKNWKEYARSITGYRGRTGVCKICRNEYKRNYRKDTNGLIDRKYKENLRNLSIGQILYFSILTDTTGSVLPLEYWKVVDKKKMQSYKLQSLTTGYFCRLDTTEGNPNYKKFYHADNLTIPKEVQSKEFHHKL